MYSEKALKRVENIRKKIDFIDNIDELLQEKDT